MKKTLVALGVMAAAGSAQAIEIYNNEGVTVDLAGDIEVVYVKGFDKDAEFQQEIQDADFGFDVRYAINDDLQFGGYWEFDGASGTVTSGQGSSADVGDTYVALYSQSIGSIKVGRTCGALDDAGVGSDFQFGISSFFNNDSTFCEDEMIRYDVDKGTFYGTVSIAQDHNNSTNIGTDGSYFDLKLGARVADFDFTGYYGDGDLTLATVPQEEQILALEARYAGVENLNLELGYYATNVKVKATGSEVDSSTVGLAADYTIDSVTIAAGYSFGSSDVDALESDNWFLNAGYALAPNTTAYAEVGGDDADNSEVGVALGVKASF
ncbi:porin [Vibrio sp. SCSIO 43135]|uniref:porin n=1 Tax=Vibrio sp. SCSIO 43135 TaxID=2819096 RepID=UPI00207517A1|nr:porin [Vibrio sp. SCSIO 43135]USD40210.1 porin [Vibrio sp. SCSIO 43135]